MSALGEFDVFLALPRQANPASWAELLAGRLRGMGRRWTVAAPDDAAHVPGWQRIAGAPARAFEQALVDAGVDHRPLLVVLAQVAVTADAAGMLLSTLDEDPMFGVAMPRFESPLGRSLSALPARRQRDVPASVHRRVLGEGQDHLITADVGGACFMLSAAVATATHCLDAENTDFAAVLESFLAGIRRLGFRTVISNRAVLPAPADAAAYTFDSHREPTASHGPAVRSSHRAFGLDGRRRFESLYSAALGPPSLVLDIRNLGALHNGTSQAALGIADAIRASAGPEWRIGLLVSPEGREFHELDRRFPSWALHAGHPDRPYATGVRLSQPWHLAELRDLHRAALVNVFLMLDTIAWDVIYAAPERLDVTWTCAARHADALVFISEFSRDRFLRRFPDARQRHTAVWRLSCDPRDYAAVRAPSGGERHILIVGNNLDHKAVAPTAAVIASAFPFDRIVALGATTNLPVSVETVPSGQLSEAEVDGLFGDAWCVIFPTYYEGFGLPVMRGLACGAAVVARRSDLLGELADHYRGGGRLHAFSTPADLVETVGRIKHGEPVESYAFGSKVPDGGTGRGWRQLAQDVLTLARELAGSPSERTWHDREQTLRVVQVD